MKNNIENTFGVQSSPETNTIKRSDSGTENSNNAEKTLTIISDIILLSGIILSILFFFIGMTKLDNHSSSDKDTGWFYLMAILYILPISIVIWSVLKVLCNISNNLKQINIKIK